MTGAVAASLMGHDYQARLFLTYAAQLRVPDSNIAQVDYEHALVRAFDDIIVYYERPILDHQYDRVDIDFFQVKYQVRQGDMFTWEALMDPAFINASAVSILQRLRVAVGEMAAAGKRARFTLLAPRPIDDDLRRLLNNAEDALDMSVLFDGTHATQRGKIRKQWREHLELESDEELRAVLAPLRIKQTRSMEDVGRDVELRLMQAGMEPWSQEARANRYDDLPKKLMQAGLKQFNRATFEELVARERLVVGPPLVRRKAAKRIGIRSFERYAERMAETTDELCCFLEFFEGRAIRQPDGWAERVQPRLESFLNQSTTGVDAVDVHLATHSSMAFAVGWQFDLKSHVDIAPVQGTSVWRPDLSIRMDGPLWSDPVVSLGEGLDVVLGLSVTHDVLPAVREYAKQHLANVGSIVGLGLRDHSGQGSVRDGTHAFRLAEEAVKKLVPHVRRGKERGTLHLFAAAPNSLMFFLGRIARRLAPVQLYEHDFEGKTPDVYSPSLCLR